MTPSITINTSLMEESIVGINVTEDFKDILIYTKPEEQLFREILGQIKKNAVTHNFRFMDESFKIACDIEQIISDVTAILPQQKKAIFYAQVQAAYLQIIFTIEKESEIKIIPLTPYTLLDFEGIGRNLDTGLYIDLALKFTENLLIHHFIAKDF